MTPSLHINSLGRIEVHTDWTLTADRTRNWTDLDLWFLVAGSGTVETPQGMHDLRPGSCLIMRGGEDYTFRRSPAELFVNYWVHFDCLDKRGRRIPPASAPAPPRYRHIAEPLMLELILERMCGIWRCRDQLARSDAEVWLEAALAEIRRVDRAKLQRRETPTTTDDVRWIEQLCRRIESHPERPWSVQTMAGDFGSSRSHFYRCFQQYTGQSPQAFVIDARLRMARVLLHDSGNDIGWIAEHLGYSDVYFFSRQFKQHHGCSPTEFRCNHGSQARRRRNAG